MSLTLRKAEERGVAEHGWLHSRHSFSFADYYDPKQMGFRSLRVINEDVVEAGGGFGTHPHRDMEIVSYVLEGALAHKDSMGNGSVIAPGEVQRMSAGSGVRHSEHNARKDGATHFLQIWILPEKNGLPPSYEQKKVPEAKGGGAFVVAASRDGRDGSVTIHQDAAIHVGRFEKGASATFELGTGRHAWIQVTRGAVTVNGVAMKAGDGAAVSDERALSFVAADPAELLLFDLA